MSVCVADDVVLPWCFSFMDVMCDVSANIARVFKSIRGSLSPVVCTDGGCGMVTCKSCSLAIGCFLCSAGGERWIIISAGRLVGAFGINPIGSMMMAGIPCCVCSIG